MPALEGYWDERLYRLRLCPSRSLLAAMPAQLFLFDILTEDGRDLTGLPQLARGDRS